MQYADYYNGRNPSTLLGPQGPGYALPPWQATSIGQFPSNKTIGYGNFTNSGNGSAPAPQYGQIPPMRTSSRGGPFPNQPGGGYYGQPPWWLRGRLKNMPEQPFQQRQTNTGGIPLYGNGPIAAPTPLAQGVAGDGQYLLQPNHKFNRLGRQHTYPRYGF